LAFRLSAGASGGRENGIGLRLRGSLVETMRTIRLAAGMGTKRGHWGDFRYLAELAIVMLVSKWWGDQPRCQLRGPDDESGALSRMIEMAAIRESDSPGGRRAA